MKKLFSLHPLKRVLTGQIGIVRQLVFCFGQSARLAQLFFLLSNAWYNEDDPEAVGDQVTVIRLFR